MLIYKCPFRICSSGLNVFFLNRANVLECAFLLYFKFFERKNVMEQHDVYHVVLCHFFFVNVVYINIIKLSSIVQVLI